MTVVRSIPVACLASCVAMLVVAHAQQPQAPTFRSGTQVVEVDVRVFDKDGHFVTNLKPGDFIIKEDGVPQQITALTLVGSEPRTQPENPRT